MSNKSFSNDKFFFVVCEEFISFYISLSAVMISLIYCKIHCLYLLIFCLVCDLIHRRFLKSISNCNTFLIFQRITLLKILKAHNKWIPFLNLLINCKPARSTPQVLSIKDECSFRFSKFLLIGLCNYSANSWFVMFSFLLPPPEFFDQKNL